MLEEIQNALDKIRRSYGTYIVRKGDTLWDIARKATGSGMNYKQIQSMNNLNDRSIIMPGQQIVILMKNPPGIYQQNQPETQESVNVDQQTDNAQPVESNANQTTPPTTSQQSTPKRKRVIPKSSVKGSSYTIKKGDTLWDIAQATYGDAYKWKQIAQDNGLDENSIYYPGDTLILRDVDNTQDQPVATTKPVTSAQPATQKSITRQRSQLENQVDNTRVNNRNQVISTEDKHITVLPLKSRPTQGDVNRFANAQIINEVYKNLDNVAIPTEILGKILYGGKSFSDYTFTIRDKKYSGIDLIASAIWDANVNSYIFRNNIDYRNLLRQCYKMGFENTIEGLLKQVYPKKSERFINYKAKLISNNLRRATRNVRFK